MASTRLTISPSSSLFFFFLLLLLLLLLPLDAGNSGAASGKGAEITYGSVIKLMHQRTKFRLHSQDVLYSSGSQQQSVTGFPGVYDSSSYWIVRPPSESSAKQGDVIENGSIIRLQHMKTRRWLHSHLYASQYLATLSCYGGDNESDTYDLWRLEIVGSGEMWKQDQRIRLRHVKTGGYLHSHDRKFRMAAQGQQEVCGVEHRRPENIWLVAEGVFFPTNGSD